jgi:putative transposase
MFLCPELVRRRGVGPCGSVVNAVNTVDLKETIKVFLLTNCDPGSTSPVFITMRSDGGANTRFDFLDFMTTCIRNSQLVAGDVLVLDNATIHKAADVISIFSSLMQAAQVRVCFLPAYSPELNPCELVFGGSKQYLRYRRRSSNPFWYEVVRGFAETSFQHMLQYYFKCIWKV